MVSLLFSHSKNDNNVRHQQICHERKGLNFVEFESLG